MGLHLAHKVVAVAVERLLVVAMVFKSTVAEDIPVVVEPELPVAYAILAKTAARTSASVSAPATTLDVATVNS